MRRTQKCRETLCASGKKRLKPQRSQLANAAVAGLAFVIRPVKLVAMHGETLKDLIHAKPFQAFTMHLADGHNVEVPHPDFILLTRGGRTAVVSTGGEHIKIVDVALVTQVTCTRDNVMAE